jgi:hypothetical protein
MWKLLRQTIQALIQILDSPSLQRGCHTAARADWDSIVSNLIHVLATASPTHFDKYFEHAKSVPFTKFAPGFPVFT